MGWHCGATTRAGGSCGNRAGFRTSHLGAGHCFLHGGASPNGAKHAEKIVAQQECEALGIPIVCDPAEALLHEVWETAGNVAYYRALVQQLPAEPGPGLYIVDDNHFRQSDDPDAPRYEDAAEPPARKWVNGEPGIYGRTYHQSGIATGEAKPHIYVQLYNEERKHLVTVTAAALKANVEERRVRMAEADATRILNAQIDALTAIGMGNKLEEFRAAFIDALRPFIEGQSATAGGALSA